MRILVVEDDTRIADPLVSALRSQYHTVDLAITGERGLELADAYEHDVVILDLMLPGISGLDVCRTLRRRGSPAKVLIMTARDAVCDKVTALDEGADDYVVKPFDSNELMARVRALARRGPDATPPIFAFGSLELEQVATEIRCDGKRLDLTRTEYVILETMLRHPTRVFSADHLYGRVSSLERAGDSGTIKSHIANLRKKLRAAVPGSPTIESVYGFGYRLAHR